MSFDWKTVNWALMSGSRVTIESPRSSRRCFTALITAARLTSTAPLRTSTAPSVFPVSRATISVCAVRLASIHASLNAGELTNARVCSSTNVRTCSVIGTASAPRAPATRGGRPRSDRESASSLVSPARSRRSTTSVATRSATAFWRAGSEASGVMVST